MYVFVCVYVSWCLCVSVRLCVCLCVRVADKKAAIGYTYEESGGGAGGAGVDSIDDNDSSDEDIDLGRSLVSRVFYRATAYNATHGIAVAILSVRPSLRCVCIVTKLNDGLRIF